MSRKAALVLSAVFLVLFAALFAAACYFVRFAIVRPGYDADRDYAAAARTAASRAPDPLEASKALIVSKDGLELAARVQRTPEESHKWLIAVHGYHSDKDGCRSTAHRFLSEGYNVLMPDLRAHGESEGRYIGMGWLDRIDLLQWIDLIVRHDPEAQIVLHGTSMGGAAVMMLAGEELPENVKGIIEDCGYTSVADMFSDQLKEMFSLPEFPLMPAARGLIAIAAGYDFENASCIEQLKKAKVPVLFIHGDADDLVDVKMAFEVYDACASEKELLVVEGAGHALSSRTDPKRYYDTVFSFIEKYCIMQ